MNRENISDSYLFQRFLVFFQLLINVCTSQTLILLSTEQSRSNDTNLIKIH